MKKVFTFVLLGFLLSNTTAWAKIDVVTTTTTLKSLVHAIGGDRVNVVSITRGSQDPHYVEAKPSYMVTLRDAELLVVVGLDLEVGWIGNVSRGARNPDILPGRNGYLDTGSLINPIEVPDGRIDRSMGDIHPGGNPHFYLDPVRMKKVANALAVRLGEIDPEGKQLYQKNLVTYESETDKRVSEWKARIAKSQVKEVITYHRTINYFLDRFGIGFAAAIEAKPGVPPTAKHILSLIDTVTTKKIPCILVESFFELKAAKRIHEETKVKVFRVPVEVDALENTGTYFDLIEAIVKDIEGCGGKR